jgi:hypothetical protein
LSAVTWNAKEGPIALGTIAQYFRGDKTWANLDTSSVSENGNLYYTDARFDSRLSSKTTSDLAEGSNLYYTDARVDSRFDTDLATKTADNLTEGITNLYYTDARADARIAAATGVSVASLVAGKILTSELPALAISNTSVVADEPAMLGLSAETGDVAVRTDLNESFILAGSDPSALADWQQLLTPTDTVLSVNGQTGIVSLTTDDISEGSNLYYTDARFDAALGAKTSDDVVEGATNLYYTDAKVDANLSTKTTDDITEGTTNKYFNITISQVASIAARDALTGMKKGDIAIVSGGGGSSYIWNGTSWIKIL